MRNLYVRICKVLAGVILFALAILAFYLNVNVLIDFFKSIK